MISHVKVVLDTNILVSALWSENGNASSIVHMIPRVIPCYSIEMYSEYLGVLNRSKFNFSAIKKQLLLYRIIAYGEVAFPEKSDITFQDESDRIFYDVARLKSAILVTGNAKHFPAEPFIVSPADFVSRFMND